MRTRSVTNRRQFLRMTIVGAAGTALLAACAPTAPPAPTAAPEKPAAAAAAPTVASQAKPGPAQAVELRLHVRTGAEGTKTEAGVDAFQKQNPGITVKLETFPGDQYQDKLLTMGAGGTLGDVAFTHVGFYHQMADGGFWMSLDPLIKASGFDMSQFFKTGLDHLTWKGNLYALPYKGHTGHSGLWYNKEMLEKEGVGTPAPKDYNEIVELAKKLTKSSGGKTDVWGYTYPGHGAWELTAHLRAWGVDPVSPKLGATKAELDQPQQVEAITWIHDLIHKHKVCPLPGSIDYSQIYTSGQVAMRTAELPTHTLQQTIGNKFTQLVVSMPKGPGGKIPGFYNHDQMAMNAKTKFRDEAWKLQTYLCGKEHGIRLGLPAGGGAGTPGIRKDVWESPELEKEVPAIKVFREHLPLMETHWYAANLQTLKVWNVTKQALDKIILNPAPPKSADFQEANSMVQSVLDEPRL